MTDLLVQVLNETIYYKRIKTITKTNKVEEMQWCNINAIIYLYMNGDVFLFKSLCLFVISLFIFNCEFLIEIKYKDFEKQTQCKITKLKIIKIKLYTVNFIFYIYESLLITNTGF